MNAYLKLARLAVLLLCAIGVAACETAPVKIETQAASQTASDDERCFVTGSRIAKRDCKDSGVGAISRESWERAMSDRPSAIPKVGN